MVFLDFNVLPTWPFSVWVVCVTGMRRLCWIWFNLWVQRLLPNPGPIAPEKLGHGITVLANWVLWHQPGTRLGQAGPPKTWRRIRKWFCQQFWNIFFHLILKHMLQNFHQKWVDVWSRILNYLAVIMSHLSWGTILPESCYVSNIEIILTTTKKQQKEARRNRKRKRREWKLKKKKKKIEKRMVEFYTRVAIPSIL